METISITEQDTRGCDVSSEEIIRVNIEVPPIPPTDFSTSNIVQVRYSIRVSNAQRVYHFFDTCFILFIEFVAAVLILVLFIFSIYKYEHTYMFASWVLLLSIVFIGHS